MERKIQVQFEHGNNDMRGRGATAGLGVQPAGCCSSTAVSCL